MVMLAALGAAAGVGGAGGKAIEAHQGDTTAPPAKLSVVSAATIRHDGVRVRSDGTGARG
jgi:hypothetical protein